MEFFWTSGPSMWSNIFVFQLITSTILFTLINHPYYCKLECMRSISKKRMSTISFCSHASHLAISLSFDRFFHKVTLTNKVRMHVTHLPKMNEYQQILFAWVPFVFSYLLITFFTKHLNKILNILIIYYSRFSFLTIEAVFFVVNVF